MFKSLLFLITFLSISISAKDKKRWIIEADFNKDGVPDKAVSENIGSFGKSGGNFEVYLNVKGKYKLIGDIYLHPAAYHVEDFNDGIRIWTYLKSSGTAGLLQAYVVKGGKLKKSGSIEINPGDGGTILGNEIYKTLFKGTGIGKARLIRIE